jgi:hypothetical protein
MEEKLDEIASLLASPQTMSLGQPVLSPQTGPWPETTHEPGNHHALSYSLKSSSRSTAPESSNGSSSGSHGPSPAYTHPMYDTQSRSLHTSTVPPLATCSPVVIPRATSRHERQAGTYQVQNPQNQPTFPITNADISAEDASRIVASFRVHMTCYFPFVIVQPGTSAVKLQQTKPVLFAAIVLVSSYYSTVQQKALSEATLRYVSEALLFKGEKNLDLLQGLLVYIAWLVSPPDEAGRELLGLAQFL